MYAILVVLPSLRQELSLSFLPHSKEPHASAETLNLAAAVKSGGRAELLAASRRRLLLYVCNVVEICTHVAYSVIQRYTVLETIDECRLILVDLNFQ